MRMALPPAALALLAWAVCLLAAAAPATAPEPPPFDPSRLRDITGIERLPPEPPPRRWWPWAAGGAAAAALGAGGWWLGRRWRRPAPPPAPATWALAEIDRLEALELPRAGRAERYHTLLSDIVRRYLEMRFRLPASQQTTAEFFASLPAAGVLTDEQAAGLRGFLERCDLAKFARAEFSAAECAAAATTARAFVAQTAADKATGKGTAALPAGKGGPPG